MTTRTKENLTIGVDLGDRYSQLCVVDPAGQEVATARVPTTPAALEQWFGHQRPARVALEAGTHSPWASRLLRELGHEVVVANPRKLRLIYENARKDDRVDAEKYLARGGTPRPGNCWGASRTGARPRRRTWRCSRRGTCSCAPGRDSSITRGAS